MRKNAIHTVGIRWIIPMNKISKGLKIDFIKLIAGHYWSVFDLCGIFQELKPTNVSSNLIKVIVILDLGP